MSETRSGFGGGALFFVALLAAGAGVAGTLYYTGHLGGAGAGASAEPEAKKALYHCPMHPSIISENPQDKCPICGMNLVPIPGAGGGSAASESHAGHADHAPAVAGLAAVEIDPARQQLIGLTTAEAAVGPVGGAWHTVGRVAVDETRVRHVNLKVPGFVERVFVDFVGKKVRKGDPLFSLYSPELLAAQEEVLLAQRMKSALGNADAEAMVAAARRKLSLWDVPEAEIERLVRTGQPTKTLTLHSPAAGVVTKKDVVGGMKLDAGAMPYEIVDLSSVWVLADVYETELRFVKEKMAATLRLNAFPNREFQGQVVFIDPLLDPRTRTVKVRLTFPNPTGELRPEMFGEVTLHGQAREGLRIPQDAVIDSGREQVVFVALALGKFQPREVELGDRDATHVEVLKGLSAGEKVVTRANFLIDSESRLRASLTEMGAAPASQPESARVLPSTGVAAPPSGPGGPTGHTGHGR